MIRLRSLPALLTVSGCVGLPLAPVTTNAGPPAAPIFAPITFFTGHTRGIGRLKVILSHVRAVRIEGNGAVASDGTLTLIQRIEQAGKPARSRRWSLRFTGAGNYAAELSDAVGPVLVKVSGNLLHIRFHAKRGLDIEQWLTLQPGSRTAQNHLVVKKLGIRVAVLNETIRKAD